MSNPNNISHINQLSTKETHFLPPHFPTFPLINRVVTKPNLTPSSKTFKMPLGVLGDITNRQAAKSVSIPSKRFLKHVENISMPQKIRKLPFQAEFVSHSGKSSTSKTEPIDIDAVDKLNHVEGSDFAAIIHKNHLNAEKRHLPNSDLFSSHKTVTKRMRSILVDWIADVCVSLKLRDSSFHLCVHILDRFLQIHDPTRSNLQLVGSVCLYIAAKYEEIYCPCADDLVRLADGAFSRDDVLVMEATILNALRFEVTSPSCLTFLTRIGKTLAAKKVPAEKVKYILRSSQMFVELAMVDGRHLRYRPSHISAAAALLAIEKSKAGVSWCESLSFHSGWSEAELIRCVQDVRELLDDQKSHNGSLNAIQRKFST